MAYFSTIDLSVARPRSKSLPIILIHANKNTHSFGDVGAGANMAQITVVKPPVPGASVCCVMLCTSKGLRKSTFTVALVLDTVYKISIGPAFTASLPAQR